MRKENPQRIILVVIVFRTKFCKNHFEEEKLSNCFLFSDSFVNKSKFFTLEVMNHEILNKNLSLATLTTGCVYSQQITFKLVTQMQFVKMREKFKMKKKMPMH